MPTTYAIPNGRTVMNATTYTATGTTQTITNNDLGTSGFKPDLVWIKPRSNVSTHYLMDSVRGASKYISSNTTSAEGTDAQYLTSFNSNGWSMGTDNSTNGWTVVGWQWQAGQGTTSSNTDGTVTSTVSVNATAGFSIVTFNAGASGSKTVGHGLGVAPKFVIVKDRTNAYTWVTYHASVVTNTSQYLELNSTNAVLTYSGIWGSTLPTSSVIGVSSGQTFNANADVVAYCWAEVAGFSQFGSYTGNASTDGPFIYTGFRPAYVMIKQSNSAEYWYILDSKRNEYNVESTPLIANLTNADGTGTFFDFVSNGFKIRGSSTYVNASGGTYIYAAFAENPFKYANAR